MKSLILVMLLFIFSDTPKEFAMTVNVFRLMSGSNELYWSNHLDSLHATTVVVLPEFDTDPQFLKPADSIRVILRNERYEVYLR